MDEMMINTWNISLGEEEARAAYESVLNRNLSEGVKVKELEEKLADYLGRKYAICVPNGSSAVLLAMMGIGIKPGDEVISIYCYRTCSETSGGGSNTCGCYGRTSSY